MKTTKITSPGMIYVPKNWPEVAINDLRNGEEGFKTSKSIQIQLIPHKLISRYD
ncbi:MAG: hypothetical protein Ct9H300mP23_00520 [Nitrospinota bacterium]|nr:MAG: hypothetical protein Ct9H300mP23_00520 [Nitrospinota bacterium]